MTPERVHQLVIEHGCRMGTGSSTCLVVINEAINFKYTFALDDLPTFSEEAFIATITTGHTRRGQPSLPGVYQDYQYRGW